jgi:high affinity Mn2+ porin
MRLLAAIALGLTLSLALAAQNPPAADSPASSPPPNQSASAAPAPAATSAAPAPAPESDSELLSLLPRHTFGRFWLSAQENVIEQAHGRFRSPYSGPNSLPDISEHAMSRIFTLYTAARVGDRADVVFDLEDASGRGIGNALGLAGFTNIDVVRIPGEGSPLSTAPYLARLVARYVVPLSSDAEAAEPGPLGVLASLPVRRLELRAGRFSLADFFDVNAVGSDSHLQFMNWTTVNDGAWDYAADTRGYTWAAMAELDDRSWSLRFAEALMPTVANGIQLEWNLRRAHAHNLEFELHPLLFGGKTATIRLLAYRNIAAMGSYREAINDFLDHRTTRPDIVSTRRPGRSKNGLGLNIEQPLTSSLRTFLRAGWNDGRNESFAYTEVDRTAEFGGDLAGDRWRRPHDKVGVAFVANALSADHREYLALGGLGFLLGDGHLNYGHEKILESYYTAHVWRGVFGAFDAQYIANPGYNRDRGPVLVPALRLHLDF